MSTAAEVEIFDVAELTEAELQAASEVPNSKPVSKLGELRSRHHAVAMMIAAGAPLAEVARLTCYTVSTVKQLQNSPAFAELISHYQEKAQRRFFDLTAKFSLLTEEALDRLAYELENTEELTPEFLLNLAKTAGDRAGYAPVQKVEARHSVHIDPDELRAMKAIANARERGSIIAADFNRQPTPREAELTALAGGSEGDSKPPMGEVEGGE